jgi:deoxyribodipyrimidine photo-lyase
MASSPGTAVVLFTRDLRVHDNPALHAAARASASVVPLFVLDEAILKSRYNAPNRARFLAQSLADLRESLTAAGADLVIRRGDLEKELLDVVRSVRADVVHLAHDVSGFAARREERLHAALDDAGAELQVHEDSLFVVPPGRVTAAGKDAMAVFTPYFNRWSREQIRKPLPAPRSLNVPTVARGALPAPADICPGKPAPDLPEGGERAGRALLERWVADRSEEYDEHHDDLAGDRTSRLSPYLHFGCVSPVDIVTAARAAASPGADAFVRQVAWRDFHHQVLASRPDATRTDYRTRGDRWRRPGPDLDAWKEGRTGLPLVDAGMRQLLREGWMHNRARLVVGHFLTKTLYLDWRLGAAHFIDHLVDGDTANNTMNWQWVAGTGTDSRFNRTYDVTAQALRHDPDGDYVRRYLPELAGISGPRVHEPWKLPVADRKNLDYPDPIVDVKEGNARFLAVRGKR